MSPNIADPYDHSYEDQPINDFIVTMKYVAEKQKDHVAFHGEVSEYVSRSDKLTELIHALEAARDAAVGQNSAKLAEQDALMAMAKKALRMNAHHVVMCSVHRNDPSVQQNAGYEFKQHAQGKARQNILDLVPMVSVKHGLAPESVLVLVKRVGGIGSVELQMTENPNDEQSWKSVGEGIYNKSRIEVRGLEAAKKIYFRARYHHNGSAGRWSSPVGIIVLDSPRH